MHDCQGCMLMLIEPSSGFFYDWAGLSLDCSWTLHLLHLVPAFQVRLCLLHICIALSPILDSPGWTYFRLSLPIYCLGDQIGTIILMLPQVSQGPRFSHWGSFWDCQNLCSINGTVEIWTCFSRGISSSALVFILMFL